MATDSRAGVGGRQGLRVLGAALAIALAAGLLAAGASATGVKGGYPLGDEVQPGKVSVLGGAKVRRWTGQTFSIEMPLEWELVADGVVAGGSGARGHTWVLRDPSARGGDPTDARWSEARKAVLARLSIVINPGADDPTIEQRARRAGDATVLADDVTAQYQLRFGDVGPLRLGAGDPHESRYAWRLNLSAAGDAETRYYFATCEKGEPREAWEITFNRRSVRDHQATLQAMLASLRTLYPAPQSAADGKDCAA